MTQYAVEIEHLFFAYNGEQVLRDIELRIPKGDYLALIGPNGGGKTTLIKIILGALTPDAGQVRILDRPPRQAASRIGYMPQMENVPRVFPATVLDVALMGRLGRTGLGPFHSRADKDAAMRSLERVGMADLAHRPIGALSGGQRQRTLIARALTSEPEILLLDEPASNIDSIGRDSLYALLGELNRDMTIILVSHDLSVIHSEVKSVACLNRHLHFHPAPEIDAEMLCMMYGGTNLKDCPVEIIAHGMPHRVLAPHNCKDCGK